MSTIKRYVNTNSASGGDGTTNTTTGVNRAYSNLAEWQSAEVTDLVSAGNVMEVICSGGADTSDVAISGWTTSAANYILIHATDDKHSGVFDANKYYFEGDSVATRMNISTGYVYIEDLQFTRLTPASSSAQRAVISWTSSVGFQYVRRNIFKFDSNVITGTVGAFQFNSSTPDYVITDNIFDNRLVNGGANNICITGIGGSADALIYNNTFINWPTAIDSKANYIVKNNIFQDCSTDISGTINASNNYNLTDNSSIGGANSVASSVLTFENKPGFNFALASGDTDAISSGIGPSSDANVSTTDVLGATRSGDSTDIGAFLESGGGGGEILAIDSGSYTLTGSNVSLKAQYKSTLESGSYSLSGSALGLIHDSKLIADSGTYSLTGTQANLTAARKIIADNGSYNLTGTDVTLVYTPGGGGEVLSIDSGSFSLSGSDIGLKVARLIGANTGNYNLTGQSLALTYNAKTAVDSGSYSLNGSNVNLFANRVIIAVNGSYSLSGSSVILKYSGDTYKTIGTVTAGFAQDRYSAEYKPTTITVNFKD